MGTALARRAIAILAIASGGCSAFAGGPAVAPDVQWGAEREDPAVWERAIWDGRDACASVSTSAPCLALRVEAEPLVERAAYRPRVEARIDGESVGGLGAAPNHTLAVGKPIAAGMHVVEVDVVLARANGGEERTVRRSIRVNLRDRQAVVVRVRVWVTESGELPTDVDFALVARNEERIEWGAYADASVEQIAARSRRLQRALGVKREQKDVIWVMCLHEKLSRVDAVLREARETRDELLRATKLGDASAVSRSRVHLALLRTRADELLRYARECIADDEPSAYDF